MNEPQYEVVSPEGRWTAAPIRPGPRTKRDARRIGFVWDHVFRGDEMFRIAEDAMRAHDPRLTFVGYQSFGDIHGRNEARMVAELPERLRAEDVDAVVVGVGA